MNITNRQNRAVSKSGDLTRRVSSAKTGAISYKGTDAWMHVDKDMANTYYYGSMSGTLEESSVPEDYLSISQSGANNRHSSTNSDGHLFDENANVKASLLERVFPYYVIFAFTFIAVLALELIIFGFNILFGR